MNFVFTEKKMAPSDDLRAYAQKKIGKLDKLFRSESTAYVTFTVERNRNIAEVTVHSGGMYYRVTESTNSMYVSIDNAVDALTRQVRKYKTRLDKRIHETVLEDFLPASPAEEPAGEFKVRRTKRFAIKPMSVDEAILQMNLLEHSFYAFRNQDEGSAFSVVYKRQDGDYGLIVSTDESEE
jgi:putative sigma-54 modulation protein